MAKQTITLCDKCHRAADPAFKFRVTVTGRNAWSGDLCGGCADQIESEYPGSDNTAPRKSTFDNIVDLDHNPTVAL